MKFYNKFIVIIIRYWHFTVNPNFDLDPKIDSHFDLNIFVFVLLFVDFIPKKFGFFANKLLFTFRICTINSSIIRSLLVL
jgi:hypothetical protein